MMRHLTTILVATFVLTATGCTSYFTVHRIKPAAAPSVTESGGLPIQLTTPEFTLTQTPPSTTNPENSYTINLTYRPDPEQRYAVNLHPAFLHEGDFKVSLGNQGQLSQVNSATREQLTPTITAVGQFAASLVGEAAKFAAFDIASDVDRALQRVCTSDAAIAAGVCSKLGKKPQIFQDERYQSSAQDGDFTDATPAQTASLDALDKRMRIFSKSDLSAKLYTQNPLEQQWLLSVWVRLKINLANQDSAESHARTDLVNAIPTASQSRVQTLLKNYESAIASGNADEAASIRPGIESMVPAAAVAKSKAYFQLELSVLLPFHQDFALVDQFVNLSDQEWRNRAATDIEDQIAQLQHNRITTGLTPAQQAKLLGLQKQLVLTIDAEDQERRRQVLLNFLNSIPTGSITTVPPINGPAMNDYATARTEYDALLATIQQKRVALQPPSKPKQLTPQTLRPVVAWCKSGPTNAQKVTDVVAGNDPNCQVGAGYDSTVGGANSSFVIVVEKGVYQ